MIEVRNLTKYYGAVRAVEDVSFSVETGDILGFLGPNGAGKSTTMRIVTCYTPPSSGHAMIAGLDIQKHSIEVRRVIGYLPESNPLYPDMSVRGYVDFMAQLKGIPSSARRAAVDEALEETGLTEPAGRLIRNLSKGFRQRVGLAQALVGNPKVLILDEPTVGLDPRQNREIRSLIRAMRGRRTVLLSTHILPEVSMTCNKVVIINQGRIEASGTPENLVSELQNTLETRLVAGGEAQRILKALECVAGVQSVRTEELADPTRREFIVILDRARESRPALARAVLEAGGELYELRTPGLSLEDIFLQVVSREKPEPVEEETNAA